MERRIAHTCTRDRPTNLALSCTDVGTRRCARIASSTSSTACSTYSRAQRSARRGLQGAVRGDRIIRARPHRVSFSARQPIDGEWLSRRLSRLGFRLRCAGEVWWGEVRWGNERRHSQAIWKDRNRSAWIHGTLLKEHTDEVARSVILGWYEKIVIQPLERVMLSKFF